MDLLLLDGARVPGAHARGARRDWCDAFARAFPTPDEPEEPEAEEPAEPAPEEPSEPEAAADAPEPEP